ncbi:MAG: hypothetical protein LBR58_01380 [Propionibacteriaceae bacterium]|jgi:hypothetical protein|nr:hypothetical protein [Propionibacteriaceae bacterium]
MWRLPKALLVIASMLALAACQGEPSVNTETTPPTATPEPTVSQTVVSNDGDEFEGDLAQLDGRPEGMLAFGKTYKSKDGLELSIAKPEPFTPLAETEWDSESGEAYLITATVKNNTGRDLKLFEISVGATNGSEAAGEIWDAQIGEEDLWPTLKKGQKATVQRAYVVKDLELFWAAIWVGQMKEVEKELRYDAEGLTAWADFGVLPG